MLWPVRVFRQLKLIGSATVHITGPGGGSFIAIFLPRVFLDLGLGLTTFHGCFQLSVPPRTRRVAGSSYCLCLSHTDRCLQSDGMQSELLLLL